MDRRAEIVAKLIMSDKYFKTDTIPEALVYDAMDEYMRESVLLAFEFVAHETTGHSMNETKGELEFKYKGQWVSKEELFENFL